MLFHRKQKHVNDVNVKIDNTMIERVQTFNFLDIMLNETLSWKSHIAMVSNKISKVIGILYRLKHVFPEYVLFTLYNSLIVSYINYGLQARVQEFARGGAQNLKAFFFFFFFAFQFLGGAQAPWPPPPWSRAWAITVGS